MAKKPIKLTASIPAPVIVQSVKTPVVVAPPLPIAAPVAAASGKTATKDINLTFRRGSFVPQKTLNMWKEMGLLMDTYFE